MLLIPGYGGAGAGVSVGSSIAPVLVEAQLSAGVWSNLSPDVVISDGLSWRYGISGNGPLDNVAATGQLTFTLRNDKANSGSTQGWYSPVHASKRAGWAFGVLVRVVMTTGVGASVTSITRAGSVATVTTGAPHGLSTGHTVLIAGAAEAEYNGVVTITSTGASTFTYAVTGTPATPATGTIAHTRAYIKFIGKVRQILPHAGEQRTQKVEVVAYDYMADILEADARALTLQVDQDEATLIQHLLSALPAAPSSRSLSSGVDRYPYAFDDVGAGQKGGALLKSIVQSAYGLAFVRGDGTFVYLNRHARGTAASQATFSNTMLDVEVPSSLDGVFNHVRTTIHPKDLDDAEVVLYSASGRTSSIGAGATVTLWGEYQDPTNPTRLIGGLNAITPVTVYTDYTANIASDGIGDDHTADVAVMATPFATTCKFEITNSHTEPVFLTRLQIRGNGVYDDGPQTLESSTPQAYGDQPIDVDMPYQANHFVGQSAAKFIDLQYQALATQVQQMTFSASRDSALLAQAMQREPGDVVTLSETMTGLASVDVVIHGIAFEAQPGPILTCRWELAPASPFTNWWRLGSAGFSELGDTTRLGF